MGAMVTRAAWRRIALVPSAATIVFAAAVALAPDGARSASSPFEEFAIAHGGGQPSLITSGSDGRLWYTVTSGSVEAMTTSGSPTEYATVGDPGGNPTGVTAAPNSGIAFLELQSPNHALGSISTITTGGAQSAGPVDTPEPANQITTGPDGKLWYTTDNNVCKQAPALNSRANCATLPGGPEADGIAPGPGPAASLWVAERTNNEILEVTQDLSTHDHPLPHPDSNPTGITLGPDGALWFTEILGNRIGRITTGGAITEYDLPHPNSDPFGITQGPDGALWFTEYAGNRIGRINPVDGKITEFTVPTSNAGAHGIVTGPDGALWFTEEFSGKIGRLAMAKPPPPQPSANIALSTPTPLAGRLLTLDPSASIPGTGSITRFAYDFNGSGTFQAICPPNEPIAYKIFDTPGSHVIGMRVTDSAGSVATTRVTVTVAGSRGRIRARTAANPAVAAVSHFWCGDRASLQAGSTAYLPLGFTSEVHAVGIDVTQGAVPDPPRPSALSRIAATSAVAFTHGTRRGPRDVRTYLLNNDKQDPRTHRITWLQRFGTTVVRVYASALIAPNGTNVPNVQMKLYGFRDGHLLPGSPLVSQTGPLDVPLGPPFTTHAMRVGYSPVDGALPAFTYTLPHDWVSSPGNVAFLAVPSLVGRRLDRQCATLECKLAEQAGSGDFQFSDTGLYIVRTVAMTAKGDPALPDPFTVFDQAANITPVAVLPTPYQGTIDITPITTCKAGDTTQPCTDPNTWVTTQIGNWLANNQPVIPATVKVATIGVHKNHGGAQGYSSWPNPCSDNASGGAICETSNSSPVSQVEANRPLTSVAHEMLHDLGRPHADDSSSGCGGNGEGKPDSKGDTLAIGLDRHPGSGGSITNPYQILSPGLPGQQSSIYDPMSYCADNNPEDNTWISAHNWDQVAGEWIFFLKRAAQSSVRQAMAAVAAGPAVQVTGVTAGTRTFITQIEPAGLSGARAAAAPPSSPVHAVVRNAAGTVVGDTPLTVTTGHLDSGTTGTPSTPVIYFNGTVPAAGAAELQIVRSGAVVAMRARSQHVPAVTLLAPRSGTIGRARTVTVRWRASDADHDALTRSVDFSPDGGRHWHTVFTAQNSRQTVALPSRYFTGSRNARVRIRVSDGFNEATAVSRRLRAIGSPPSVEITAPLARQSFPSDATVLLSGTAFDDSFHLLTGRRLRWFAGRRALGRGQSVTARDLPPGRVTIRLVARDAHGRSSTSTVRIRVLAATPFFTTLRAPASVKPAARRVTLTLATNIVATLTLGRQRFELSRHSRTVGVGVKPGKSTLTLTLALAARGKRATQTLRITRR
jgi:virginiamycin B lyase